MNTKIDSLRPFSALAARLVLGSIMLVHGGTKVLPHGALDRFSVYIAQLGFPSWMAYVSAFTEFLGGMALILGVITSVATIAIGIDMAVAIAKVHITHGLTGNGGFEFPLSLLALALLLLADGPGMFSLDSIAFRHK